MGELLKEMPRNAGGRPTETGSREGPVSLGQLGISKNESSAFQRLASVQEDDFESRLTAARDNGRVSRAAVFHDEAVDEGQQAREEFDAFVASITPPGYDPTFDNEAVEDVGHLDGVCMDVLELTARRSAEEFAARYHARRTIPGLLPKLAEAANYLTTVRKHPEEHLG